MKLAGEFSLTLEFGDGDVDATIEWSADDGNLEYLEMAVSVAHLRLTKNGEKARDAEGNYRIDYLDIQDELKDEKQQELWVRCFVDAKDELNNYDGPEDIDYAPKSMEEEGRRAWEEMRRVN